MAIYNPFKKEENVEKVKDEIDLSLLPTPEEVGERFVETVSNTDEESQNELLEAEEPQEEQDEIAEKEMGKKTNGGVYIVKRENRKFKVVAANLAEAEAKVDRLLGIEPEDEPVVEQESHQEDEEQNEEEHPNTVTIHDILSASAAEIKRIVTEVHPECVSQDYAKWGLVLAEECGEIIHEINDLYEGNSKKNLFVECIQLISATVLLAKKFAKDNPEMFGE